LERLSCFGEEEEESSSDSESTKLMTRLLACTASASASASESESESETASASDAPTSIQTARTLPPWIRASYTLAARMANTDTPRPITSTETSTLKHVSGDMSLLWYQWSEMIRGRDVPSRAVAMFLHSMMTSLRRPQRPRVTPESPFAEFWRGEEKERTQGHVYNNQKEKNARGVMEKERTQGQPERNDEKEVKDRRRAYLSMEVVSISRVYLRVHPAH
jgi:hypothetical protein